MGLPASVCLLFVLIAPGFTKIEVPELDDMSEPTYQKGIPVGISHSLNKTRVLRGSCSNALAKVTLSADQQKSLLDAHASARGRVAPSAAGMKTLTWDDQIAMRAQFRASECKLADGVHFDCNNRRLGRNALALTDSEASDLGQAVARWEAEKAAYNLADNSCAAGKTCAHYKQVVWAETTSIGCGMSACAKATSSDGKDVDNVNVLVCDYAPASDKNAPYLSAQSLEGANKNRAHCTDDQRAQVKKCRNECLKKVPSCVSDVCEPARRTCMAKCTTDLNTCRASANTRRAACDKDCRAALKPCLKTCMSSSKDVKKRKACKKVCVKTLKSCRRVCSGFTPKACDAAVPVCRTKCTTTSDDCKEACRTTGVEKCREPCGTCPD